MYEYICEQCGKVVQVEREWQVQRFCSKSCAASHGNKLRFSEKTTDGSCIYQPESIICDRANCSTCGWNPEVAKARLENIVAELPEQETEVKAHFGDWISVETRLPRDGVQVLAYTHTGRIMSLHCKGDRWCAPLNVVVTHWMPMPDAPKV